MTLPNQKPIIGSKANTTFQTLKKLAHDNQAARLQGRVWLEGDHLCRAAVERGYQAQMLVATHEGLDALTQFGLPVPAQVVLVTDGLWSELTQLKSSLHFAYVLAVGGGVAVSPDLATVVLDRVQDPGNVGSMLRSAAAFGYRQVLALKGTASIWSPKVLRAGMGAHFGLKIVEGLSEPDLVLLDFAWVVTSSHQGHPLSALEALPKTKPLAWIFGNEGKGVSDGLMKIAGYRIRIEQPGGEESLNVAAAAAICLHASAVPRLAQL